MGQDMSRRAVLGGLAATTMLGGPVRAALPRPPRDCAISTPLDVIANRLLQFTPETATYNGVPAALDGGPLARRLDDYSPDGEARWRAALGEGAASVATMHCNGDPEGALQLDTARAILANATRSRGIPYGRINAFNFSGHVPYLVTQIAGPHIDSVNVMLSQQSLATPHAVDAWIEKLDGFHGSFTGVIDKLRADELAGCRPPRVLLAGALPVLDSFINGPSDKHPLIESLRSRMAAAGLDARLCEAATTRAIRALDDSARPAFVVLRTQIADCATRGREEAGLWAQPHGDELYAANIRALGDSPLPPGTIHALGLAEIERISDQMERLLRRQGMSQGSVGARMAALATDPRFLFPDSDAGRAQLLDYLRGRVHAAEARYPRILPAAMIPRQSLEIRRVPVATQDGAPGGFYDGPSLDGSRPGVYWINLRDMKAVPKFSLPTLSFHEGVPGHHTQGAIALGIGEAPLLLRLASFNAYQEGWALYAERLASEIGLYAGDPWGDLGRLRDELFRAVRLVVDTGLHHERWTREKAIAYMVSVTGMTQGGVTAEVERYMAWPGQALGYKLGQLRLLDLRAQYRKAHGRHFDIRRFHAAVLGKGPLPLDLVERQVLAAGPDRKRAARA